MRIVRHTPSAIILPLLAALAGGLAWSPLGLFVLLPIFALAYGWADSKRQQIAVILAYYFGALWSVAGVFNGFWPHVNPWVGIAGWIGATLLIATPWVVAVFIGPDSPMMRSVRFFIGLLVSALPPLGAYGLASPWIFVTAWFPGTGIAGLCMGGIWLSLLAGWARHIPITRPHTDHLYLHAETHPVPKTSYVSRGILISGILWALTTNLVYLPPSQPSHWATVHTDLIGFRGPVPAAIWMQRQVQTARIVRSAILSHPNHTRILFPESMAGPQFPNFFTALMVHGMASMARQHGDTLLIGADDLANPDGNYTDSLNIMGQYQGIISARQPAPFGEWRPWARHTALANWWHFGSYRLGNKSVALAVCYEQMLVWPIAWDFLGGGHKPSVLLAPADHDWARGILEPAIQKQALTAWARLYQIPFLYANNSPPRAKPTRSDSLAKPS